MIEKVCHECGQKFSFEYKGKNKTFCSGKCGRYNYYKRNKCNLDFKTKDNNRRRMLRQKKFGGIEKKELLLECLECKNKFKRITNTHLKYCCGLSMEDYAKKHNIKKDILLWKPEKDHHSEIMSGSGNSTYGLIRTKEWRENIRNSLKGKKNPKGSEASRRAFREGKRKVIAPLDNSSIEIKIQNFLKLLKIEFFTHYYINITQGYECDILIPSMNLIIEGDGDYWHGNLERFGDWRNLTLKQKVQKIRDFERTNQLEEKGFKVLRLWVHCCIRGS